ncbi:unnamed protein product (macronuclear) [Paramecium tetraurelia]|uniref:Transmembrane protein n=1 Tax=Paramecium tetraurelia TaxID=5888 RepID=A0D145_PARTE|nr:uncharacterized protein GSPATT00039177001 [Paramecium tetraurelia]CAK76762.1 unnamed protein product [Paramecium tetraurelia]|eukprot:XP_001444159.1 hypothetical protein (macronuclear) [Paramecium tetraurelia strain d4-2]
MQSLFIQVLPSRFFLQYFNYSVYKLFFERFVILIVNQQLISIIFYCLIATSALELNNCIYSQLELLYQCVVVASCRRTQTCYFSIKLKSVKLFMFGLKMNSGQNCDTHSSIMIAVEVAFKKYKKGCQLKIYIDNQLISYLANSFQQCIMTILVHLCLTIQLVQYLIPDVQNTYHIRFFGLYSRATIITSCTFYVGNEVTKILFSQMHEWNLKMLVHNLVTYLYYPSKELLGLLAITKLQECLLSKISPLLHHISYISYFVLLLIMATSFIISILQTIRFKCNYNNYLRLCQTLINNLYIHKENEKGDQSKSLLILHLLLSCAQSPTYYLSFTYINLINQLFTRISYQKLIMFVRMFLNSQNSLFYF